MRKYFLGVCLVLAASQALAEVHGVRIKTFFDTKTIGGIFGGIGNQKQCYAIPLAENALMAPANCLFDRLNNKTFNGLEIKRVKDVYRALSQKNKDFKVMQIQISSDYIKQGEGYSDSIGFIMFNKKLFITSSEQGWRYSHWDKKKSLVLDAFNFQPYLTLNHAQNRQLFELRSFPKDKMVGTPLYNIEPKAGQVVGLYIGGGIAVMFNSKIVDHIEAVQLTAGGYLAF